MKSLLVGLLAIGSLSAYAQTMSQAGRTYYIENGSITITSSILDHARELTGKDFQFEKSKEQESIPTDRNEIYEKLFLSRTAPKVEGMFFGDEQGYMAENGIGIVVAKPFLTTHIAIFVNNRTFKIPEHIDDGNHEVSEAGKMYYIDEFIRLSRLQFVTKKIGPVMELYLETSTQDDGSLKIENARFLVEGEYNNQTKVDTKEAQNICSIFSKKVREVQQQNSPGLTFRKAKKFKRWKQCGVLNCIGQNKKTSLESIICD
jgi:hypothetical protein